MHKQINKVQNTSPPFCKHICIKQQINKHAYINSINISPHFRQFINKGAKTNQTIRLYMRYNIHEEERRKVNCPAYMHLYEKR